MTTDVENNLETFSKKKALTIEDWSRTISNETHGDIGKFRFMERRIFSSKAYIDLTLVQREILKCYLNKIVYAKKDKKNKKRNSSGPLNGDSLMVTNNEIKARKIVGPKNDRSIAEARKALVQIGFLDVVKTGTYLGSGIFALSDRWTRYPNGDYQPKDSKPAGYAMYSNINDSYNKKRVSS